MNRYEFTDKSKDSVVVERVNGAIVVTFEDNSTREKVSMRFTKKNIKDIETILEMLKEETT